MMLDGLEPPTSVYETYAFPAATASLFLLFREVRERMGSLASIGLIRVFVLYTCNDNTGITLCLIPKNYNRL